MSPRSTLHGKVKSYNSFMSKIESITVKNTINAPVEKVWQMWTLPEHITKWNNASDDWHSPRATNNLVVGGTFSTRMESRDGKEGFDFNGTYQKIEKHSLISYVMEDGRKVTIVFKDKKGKTEVVETFDPENENPIEMQRGGWQAILDNFKKYVESNSGKLVG